MNLKKTLTLGLLLLSCTIANAHDFVVTLDGQKVYFNILSKKDKTVEVTYNGSISKKLPTYIDGELTIPAKVKHDNIVYSVVGISAKAFSGADKLTSIVMPMGMTMIGDFAFEGCISLNKVIFPGNTIKFGQGVFYKCNKIQNVSFGSDWKKIDLKVFRWSDSLTVVNIPAKIEKIQNMKSLKNIESISVDINNERFSSIDGILYNKSQDIVYGCPRAYKGNVKIVNGVETINSGAFIDCKEITRIDLPASITTMSFREFSRIVGLKEIIFRSERPIFTAKKEGKEVMVLQVANPTVEIIVPKQAKNAYKEALNQITGEYTELNDSIPYTVETSKMPSIKNIVGVKNFNKYE